MAAGPKKPGRLRHLESFGKEPVITTVINACTFDAIKLCVIVRKDNNELIDYLQRKHPHAKVIKAPDQRLLTSFHCALNEDNNDTLIVAGDLKQLQKAQVQKFINSPFKSAMYKVRIPWGKTLVSVDKKLIRRSDIGDSLVLISQEHKADYLSPTMIRRAQAYHKRFYPQREFNMERANFLWTWLDYAFFFEISSSTTGKSTGKGGDIGLIFMEDQIYDDND